MTILANRTPEVHEKFFQTLQLSGQIATYLTKEKPTANDSAYYASLLRRRAELKALIPPFQVIEGGKR